MKAYREAPIGVIETATGKLITPNDSVAWREYHRWVAAGNLPDPQPPPPPMPLAERQARRKQRAREEAHRNSTRGVTALDTRFILSVSDIALLSAMLAANRLPIHFGWRDANGAFVPLNIAQVRELLEAYTAREFGRLRNLWQLEAAIDTTFAPDAVDVAAGWPE